MENLVVSFEAVGIKDVDQVGGKNASLGEMIRNLTDVGIQVPGGFATTADAFRTFIAEAGLTDRIQQALVALDTEDMKALAKTGNEVRQWVREAVFSPSLEQAILSEYRKLCANQPAGFSVAVRSSATAEDLPNASFAGQQETFLNVQGDAQLLWAVKEVFASLYNDRAISYRVHQGFPHEKVALSAGIQRMVRSDVGASGVMFTMDTESGYPNVVFITSAYGLGETVVQGSVNPDEFYVFKPAISQGKFPILRKNIGSKQIRMCYAAQGASEKRVVTEDVPVALRNRFSINDEEVISLARAAMKIEEHYGMHMDIEWAKDGISGEIFIVQARPETVQSRSGRVMERYAFRSVTPEPLITGRSIGQRIGAGKARIIANASQMHEVETGDVLITDMTDPDWEPVMKKAAAIITNRGGRTCHAAIIARELGIPAIVGCGDATEKLQQQTEVTVSCAQGDTGFVYAGKLAFDRLEIRLDEMPKAPTKIMMNVGNPERAFDFAQIPNEGVGLARVEFIINQMIGIHPKALLEFDQQTPQMQEKIQQRIAGYANPRRFYIDKLAEGIATIAAPFYPKPVIIRCSDFKSNEYANLLGGDRYEPQEENPMIGFRGAGRYIAPAFQDCFLLECEALKKVRNEMGLTNVEIMIPFVRTLEQASKVVALLAQQGLKRGEQGLRLIMMCEIPSNVLLAEEFLEMFDGFSIGSNDLTQLTLGLDRDSMLVADSFDERNPAVLKLLHQVIQICRVKKKYIGICGQGPSDYPDFAQWLVKEGIESISLNPDTVVETWLHLSKLS